MANTKIQYSARGIRLVIAALTIPFIFAISTTAHAQWRVKDEDANKTLGDSGNGTISSNVYNLNKKLTVIGNESKPGDRIADPTPALPKPDDGTATLDDGKQCDSVAKAQTETCKKIVDIENAQYKFMLSVYKTSNDRNEVLKTLLTERNGLKADDYGKIADNTNKLTALYNLIALDRQQMESVNYAYEANLRYLRATQARAADSAQTGSGKSGGGGGGITLPGIGEVNLGAVISGLTTGVVLKGALDAQQTNADGMKTLSISKGSSWW
jgi:hypothetical protein